uniref:RRM domain-containing protein n=1 Tax=Oryza glaberrima TaxID=4538 RepID=I1PE90_ORYGL
MAAPDVEYRCFVGGLAWATDDRSLEAAFSTYGEILDSKVILSYPCQNHLIIESSRYRVQWLSRVEKPSIHPSSVRCSSSVMLP